MNFACRSCGNIDVLPILSLGQMPLANALLTQEQLSQSEELFPLELVFCPQCTLVQITETVSPEKLFREYLYYSSFSDTVLNNARDIVNRLSKRHRLNKDSFVVEVASNDGYLLKNYREKGIPVLGVEPARNIAKVAEEQGIPTVSEFFDVQLAEQLWKRYGGADIIHANNVVAHVADLHGVVAGMAVLLKEDGVAVIENHYVRDMIDHAEFDAIYHEHVCYYSATSFCNLFAQHGLVLVDVERLPVHGGSLRVYFQRANGPRSFEKEGRARLERLLQDEADYGIDQFDFYQNFGEKVERLRYELLELLEKIKAEGKRIVAYGASAKSTTLLNYYGIGKEILDFVVDRSTVKQGRYTPGTRLPIFAPEALLAHQPDYVLLLTWNFADEILAQQAEYRKRGGRFIVPIPELRVV
jgi:C-methyltransferase C-terminal domain/Putative zinc binding domain/Methyltransferase domain